MNPALLAVVIQELPTVIALLKAAFASRHPNEPVPTDAEVIAAELQAFVSSVAKDDAWLAAHPNV